MPRQNLSSSLRRRARPDPMRAFDALPGDLRHWLAGASLPWSPQSVRRLWARALAQNGGCRAAALAYLGRVEARQIARDARAIWGKGHPACDGPG